MAQRRQNYKWDGDSRDERPSEFARSGYSTMNDSAFHSTRSHLGASGRHRAPLSAAVRPLLVAAGLSSLVLYGVVALLRG